MHTSLIFSSVHKRKKKALTIFRVALRVESLPSKAQNEGREKKSSRDKRLLLNDGHSGDRESLLSYRNPAAQQSLRSQTGFQSQRDPGLVAFRMQDPDGVTGVARETGHAATSQCPAPHRLIAALFTTIVPKQTNKNINPQIATVGKVMC